MMLASFSACDSTPDTPQNAVMDYLVAADLGRQSEADERLCPRLRESTDKDELAILDKIVHRASVFGEGLKHQDDRSAVVKLRVVFAPAPPGAKGESWEAQLVKDGGWKVCGFSPADG